MMLSLKAKAQANLLTMLRGPTRYRWAVYGLGILDHANHCSPEIWLWLSTI